MHTHSFLNPDITMRLSILIVILFGISMLLSFLKQKKNEQLPLMTCWIFPILVTNFVFYNFTFLSLCKKTSHLFRFEPLIYSKWLCLIIIIGYILLNLNKIKNKLIKKIDIVYVFSIYLFLFFYFMCLERFLY